LERLIFYQLSELKRLQIRAGKSDERVLVKRLIEEYDRTGFIGLSRYNGPFSFKRFEKYLYGEFFPSKNQTTEIHRYHMISDVIDVSAVMDERGYWGISLMAFDGF